MLAGLRYLHILKIKNLWHQDETDHIWKNIFLKDVFRTLSNIITDVLHVVLIIPLFFVMPTKPYGQKSFIALYICWSFTDCLSKNIHILLMFYFKLLSNTYVFLDNCPSGMIFTREDNVVSCKGIKLELSLNPLTTNIPLIWGEDWLLVG